MNILNTRAAYGVLSIICAYLLLVGCEADEDLGAFTPETPVISLDPGELAVTKETASYTVNVASNLPWRAETHDSWVTLTTARALADGALEFSVEKNNTTEPREGTVRVWVTDDSEVVLHIMQEAGDLPPDIKNHVYVKESGAGDGSSWENATTLANALTLELFDGDFIHVAAGTYRPVNTVSGGNAADDNDVTFEIKQNLQIIGGYPANPSESDEPDPLANATVLNGLLASGTGVNHVITVSAPANAGQKVLLSGLTVQNGDANSSGSNAINGVNYPRNYGAGLIIAQSSVEMVQCEVTANKGTGHGIGMYVFSSATVWMDRCAIRANVGGVSNGTGFYVNGGDATIWNSTIENNTTDGVGAGIQTLGSSSLRLYNTTIANNIAGAFGGLNKRAGGLYNRDNSTAVLVNCTIYGNTATGLGGGIHTHATSTTELISCTIANNSGVGGGINNTAGCVINLYNSILSGNTEAGAPSELVGDITTRKSIIGSTVYGADGEVVAGATFDYATMLGALAGNGGNTETCLLLGTDNPAVTNGMSATELFVLGNTFTPAVPEEYTSADQAGNSREGKTSIGAVANQ